MMTGVSMIHVPYKGQPQAMADLLAGQVQVMFDTVPSSIANIKAGKLRALAVTTSSRVDALPEIPTMSEFVQGFEASGWQGLGMSINSSTEIVERLNSAINVVLIDPTIKTRFAELGATVVTGSPAAFAKRIADETEKWAKVIEFSGAHVD